MRKITKTELDFWQYQKRPRFADSIPYYHKPSIHDIINAKALGSTAEKHKTHCSNTLNLLRGRKASAPLRSCFYGFYNCASDPRRVERTTKWLKRILEATS